MTHISNLIDLSKVKSEKESMDAPDKASVQVINWLFRELRSNFTAFKQAWPDQETYNQAKKTWIKAFVLSGISRIEQLQHGLNKCYLMEKPFVPSPGEFISWCTPTPQELGFPSVDEAYRMSIELNRQFSDFKIDDARVETVIRHSIRQIDSLRYRSMPMAQAKKEFEYNYTVALKQFMEGKLELIKKALPEKAEPHPVDKEKSDAARRKAMEALRGIGINVKRTDDRGLQENPVQGGN